MKIQLLLVAACLLTTACADKAPDKKGRPMTAAQQHPFLNQVVGSGHVSPYTFGEPGSNKKHGKRSSLALHTERSSSSRRHELAPRNRSLAAVEPIAAPRKAPNREAAKAAAIESPLAGVLGTGAATADNQPKPLILSTPSD